MKGPKTNVLTNFHEEVLTTALGGHFFLQTQTVIKLILDIICTNLLTKFHEDWTINVVSRVLTRKKCPAPWRPYIIGTHVLTTFHEDRRIYVASRVLTRKMPRLLAAVFFNQTIFKLIQDMIGTNLLNKFHEDRTIN
ncbi:hypothetical protein DPMN_060998 [Dreissena polymorpha]|uniref:Uncharacterized protein n=1 Tax=Dreissena polymorpha TaxID=45954 RepID=A0A9D4C746_DREPO|nr:hypothetical protein DPMN_060998 [Dreissena polymorpha]